jgi:streptomycin 3"-adenylyltransferase
MLDQYLAGLVNRCREVLGANLVGVYLQGSGAQGDYHQGKSDVDVLAVVSQPVPVQEKQRLCRLLDHSALPVPAAGLDFIVATEAAVRHPEKSPRHELWFSTGATWQTSIETAGDTSEHLILFQTCRDQGRSLFGPQADQVFAQVPRPLLLNALVGVVEWHAARILDPFHDPAGQYSVLNACRAWHYAEEGRLVSKSEGARWGLANEPQNALLRDALAIRLGTASGPLAPEEISGFLDRVIGILRAEEGR